MIGRRVVCKGGAGAVVGEGCRYARYARYVRGGMRLWLRLECAWDWDGACACVCARAGLAWDCAAAVAAPSE